MHDSDSQSDVFFFFLRGNGVRFIVFAGTMGAHGTRTPCLELCDPERK
jgi:hypothetical protein